MKIFLAVIIIRGYPEALALLNKESGENPELSRSGIFASDPENDTATGGKSQDFKGVRILAPVSV